jgi:parallel beta-helix repeat protein
MSRVGSMAVAFLSLLGLFVLQGAGPAFAGHVTCGQTITQDMALDSDLMNCPADGVVIGADNVRLDLNGHIIHGGANLGVEFPAGVRNAGHSGVTIENGRISNFHEGVRVDSVFENGVRVKTASNNVVRGLGFSTVAATVTFADVIDSTIANTFGSLTGGVILVRSDSNRVVRNLISHIHVCCGNDNGVERNSAGGIEATFGAHGTVVERNDVSGFGIRLFQSNGVRLERNVVRFATDGIFVWNNSAGAVLNRNTAADNSGDGIDVDNPTATLTGNRANDNGDLGIEAVPGVSDGGGNRAFGNGNTLQCLNVACK